MKSYDDYLPGYPIIQDEDFYNRIVEKKEFWDGQDDMFFRHQINIARYMAQWTLYDSLLVYHEMGTGKSALTVAMTELAKENTFYKKVLYIAHNQTQIYNYKNEIKRFSPRLSSFFKNVMKSLSEERARSRWNSILANDMYEFYTFGTFATDFLKRPESSIKANYEKCIIIIDEAHHLVHTNNQDNTNSYNALMKVLSLLTYKKVLVMSGTPIRDQPDEIVPLLNLVLPPEKRFARNEFIHSFFNVREHVRVNDNVRLPLYEWKPNGKQDFIQRIQGYVSYVKRRQSNARIEYEGKIYAPMKNIKILAHRMDPFQNVVYSNIFIKERGLEEGSPSTSKTAFYSSSKQAELFVFPDEEVGEKGYKKYVSPTFTLRPVFLETFGDYKQMSTEDLLDLLKQFSVSYAYVIGEIMNHPKELVYIFSDLVEGSGIMLFMSILKTLFGFKLITSKKDLEEKVGKRMILLNDRVANEDDFQDFIQYFNNPKNKHGDFCQIIMGTNKTKEGISLRNVRQIHILTPSWNLADTSQAMARSLRARSHEDLENPLVKIFFHVSVPFTGEDDDFENWVEGKSPITENDLLSSVDFQRYYRSEIKEQNVKLLDRAFLEGSWDCFMNLPHNSETGRHDDYSRECEYDTCEYKCFGVSHDIVPGSDVSNFNAYYSNEEELALMNQIREYFAQHSYARFPEFYNFFPHYNPILIEKCLTTMIYQPLLLRDYRHFPCFLSYKNGVLFLTDNPYLPVGKENYESYYQLYPSTRVVFPLPDLLDSYFIRHQKFIIPKLLRLINMKNPNAKELFLSLPLDFQALFSETTIQSQVLHPTQISVDAIGWFVQEFKTDMEYIPNVLIRHRFLPDKKQYRELNLKKASAGWKLL